MTTPQNLQLSDDELELLSAYIDNRLAAAERGALEQRLSRDPALRTTLDELRGTVALLRELEPLPPPRSFTLDPAAFAPRPSRLFGWLRLGATLASVLLALTFAVDFVGRSGVPGAPTAGGSAAVAPAPAQQESQRSTLLLATSAPAAGGAAAAAPTAAPAAAAPLQPTMSAKAAEPTAAPAAPEAPAAASGPASTAAAEAIQAAPSPTAEATTEIVQSTDTNTTAAPAATEAPAAPAPTQVEAQSSNAPAAANSASAPTLAPVTTSGSQSPGTAQLDQSPPAQPPIAAPQSTIRPIRLVEIGLAGLALLLGLGALWVRRRER